MGLFQRMTDTLRGRSTSSQLSTVQQAPVASTTQDEKFNFEDYLAMGELAFEWADSYDCKDRERLAKILAPTIAVDYTEVNGNVYDSMPAQQFVDFMFHPGFVGDPLVNTQHLLGGVKYVQRSANEIYGYHQLRAAHQRYTGPDRQTIENKGHGHAMIRLKFVRLNRVWKFAGLRPEVRWNEYAFDKIFVNFNPKAVLPPSSQDLAKVTKSAMDVREVFVEPGNIEVA